MEKWTDKQIQDWLNLDVETEAGQQRPIVSSAGLSSIRKVKQWVEDDFADPALRRVDRILLNAPMIGPSPGFAYRFEAQLARRTKRRKTWLSFWLTSFILTLAGGLFLWSFADTGQSLVSLLSNVEATNTLIDTFVRLVQSTLASLLAVLRAFTLLAEASLQLMQHSLFLGYATLAGGLIGLWVQLLRRLNQPQETLAAQQMAS